MPQLAETLELYERATTRWGAERRQPHHLAAMTARNKEFAAACASGNPRAIVDTNWAFHDAINQASGNHFVAADCSKLLRGVMRVSLLSFRQRDPALASYEELAAEHQDMIDAIAAGDADRAEALVYRHSDEFRERMKTFIGGTSTSSLSLR